MGGNDAIGVVFDIPDEAWTREIQRLRIVHNPDRAHFPVEITVAGSSGLGWLSPSQTRDAIAGQIEEIASDVAPFQTFFSHVEVFPKSQVYYLSLADESPFHAFQRTLAASHLQFEAVKFPYKPHCTIAALSMNATPAAHAELLDFPVPKHAITISSLSLYAVNLSANTCHHAHRVRLGA